MLIKFEEITLEELSMVSFGRIDGDRKVLIIGKEADDDFRRSQKRS